MDPLLAGAGLGKIALPPPATAWGAGTGVPPWLSKTTVYVTGSLPEGEEHPVNPVTASAANSAVMRQTLPMENFRDKDIICPSCENTKPALSLAGHIIKRGLTYALKKSAQRSILTMLL
jgi:hypothetical protein